MTFEECKNEYPVGSIIGFFHVSEEPCTTLAVKLMLLKSNRLWLLGDDFFINRDGMYYRVSPHYRICEGYTTQDGESFSAYTTEDGYFCSFSYRENKHNKCFFLIPNEETNLKFQLIQEWEKQTSEKAIYSYETFMEDF